MGRRFFLCLVWFGLFDDDGLLSLGLNFVAARVNVTKSEAVDVSGGVRGNLAVATFHASF
jgi:hypothetical protein